MSSQSFIPVSNATSMYVERSAFAPHKNYQVAPPRSDIRKPQSEEQLAVVSALEKYDILSRVGEGSFGVVHQCRLKNEKQLAQPLGKFSHLAGRMLAIKKFRTEGQDDIALREIKMLKVSHLDVSLRKNLSEEDRLCRAIRISSSYTRSFVAKEGSTW